MTGADSYFSIDWFSSNGTTAAAAAATNASTAAAATAATSVASSGGGGGVTAAATATAAATTLAAAFSAARAAAADPFLLQCAGATLAAGYLAGVVACNAAGAYQDALIALREHRRRNPNWTTSSDAALDEWTAARKGAYADGYARFWRSLVWPATAVMDVVPNIVLLLHPPPRRAAAIAAAVAAR